MNRFKEIFFWIFLVSAILLSISYKTHTLPDAKKRLEAIPIQGTHYTSHNLSPTPEENLLYHGCHMVKRIYTIGNQKVFISIIDGTGNRNAVHDPAVCFTGSGWIVTDRTPLKTHQGDLKILTLKKDELKLEVLVWFSEENRIYASAITYWLRSALRRLSYGRSGPEPVRIVIQPLFPNQSVDWKKLLEKFPELLRI